jgi:hypothetical protein
MKYYRLYSLDARGHSAGMEPTIADAVDSRPSPIGASTKQFHWEGLSRSLQTLCLWLPAHWSPPPEQPLPVFSRVRYDADLTLFYRHVTMRIDKIEPSEQSSHHSPGRLLPWVPLIIYVALIAIISAALYGMTLLQN